MGKFNSRPRKVLQFATVSHYSKIIYRFSSFFIVFNILFDVLFIGRGEL